MDVLFVLRQRRSSECAKEQSSSVQMHVHTSDLESTFLTVSVFLHHAPEKDVCVCVCVFVFGEEHARLH